MERDLQDASTTYRLAAEAYRAGFAPRVVDRLLETARKLDAKAANK